MSESQSRDGMADEQDSVSVLTEASKLSVLSQAAMLLRGVNPNGPILEESEEDDEEQEELLGVTVPSGEDGSVKSKSLVTWKSTVEELPPVQIDFLKDDVHEMTYGRRIALFLMKYSWYNPQAGTKKKKKPSTNEEGNGTELNDATEQVRNNKKHNDEEEEENWLNACHPYLLRAIDAQQNHHPQQAEISPPTSPQHISSFYQAYPFTYARKEKPSLAKAWAYFDHVALTRYVEDSKEKLSCCGSPKLQRAEPGERQFPTKLYSPLLTPHSQLGDFGLGIGLYFSTLRAITILCILAGLLNIPNFIYFSGSEYGNDVGGVSWRFRGSAYCNNTEWVFCETCETQSFDQARIAQIVSENSTFDNSTFPIDGSTNETILPKYAYLRNNCSQDNELAVYINYATLMLVLVGVIALNIYLKRMETLYDEDEQTAQDYSIIVKNPPGDATDPQEWHNWVRDAFDGHLTACTIAVDNDLLVRSLVQRRELLRKIELMVEPGTSLDLVTLAGLAAREERSRKFWGIVKAKLMPGLPEIYAQLTVLTAKVQGLAQQDYPATEVFLTLETEATQRKILQALSVGSVDVRRQKSKKVKKKLKFRRQLILDVAEPDEPNTVRWQDLNEKFKDRMKQQALTMICTIIAIILIAFLVWFLNGLSLQFAAYAIAIFNSIFPMFAKMLTDFEAHASEGGKQRSLYVKIALFRWVNTAIVITLIFPFTATINGKLIPQIEALFFAEIVTTTAIQLLDPAGHFERHLLAPRAPTQDAMNLKMQGSLIELAERYTNMTKILFLALWYCAIYPGALVLCSIALFINYYADRFSLMRTWKRPSMLGTQMSEMSRRYFVSLALVAMAVVSSYYWASFPFDNLCPTASTNTSVEGSWALNLTLNDNFIADYTTVSDPQAYDYCLQDFFRYDKDQWVFPFIARFQNPDEAWMSPTQERTSEIYGWTSVAIVGLVLLSFVYRLALQCRGILHGTYSACGDDQGIAFSDLASKSVYVPEVKSPAFSYPLLAVSGLDAIDKDLLEWTDHDRPHVFYDLTKDAEVLLRGTDVSSKVVFSTMAHWPSSTKESK